MDTQNKKILIVEDDTDLREALKTALTYEHFDVSTAENGQQGLDAALVTKPDLILLDVVMPVMDGLTMLKALREDAWGATANVVVMTALDDLEKIAEVIEAGGEYLVKTNITLGAVVEKVKEKLGIA